MKAALSPRLAAAGMIPRGTRLVADVGTDHAYLPIALVSSGAAERAIASDVRPGPLARARENIAAAGMEGRISTHLADGMAPLAALRPDVIVAAGMGGELIASMLAAAPFTRGENAPLLILQPMTRAEALREYLAHSGYAILDERLADEGAIYQLIAARYDGAAYELTPAELLCGRVILRSGSATARRFVAERRAEVAKIISCRSRSASGVPRELVTLAEELEKYDA